MKTLSYIAGLLIVLSSCTMVTSKNLPGKKIATFPKNMQGSYSFQYPESFAAMMEGVSSDVVINANQILMTTDGKENVMQLNDSLFLSKIKKDLYLSIGAVPSLTVFKLVPNGTNWDLYPMFTENASVEDMQPYFKSVEATQMPSEDGEAAGDMIYEVTINDKKLAAYFKSDLPSKDPFKLIRK